MSAIMSFRERVVRLRCGFTLIELLVVVAIIALLISILLPALARARDQSRLTVCLSNLRSQGASVLAYAQDHGGKLPPRWTQWTNASGNTEFFLINAFLARYERRAFEIVNPPWATPTGAWRCADISQNDDAQRLTHTGYLHAAPNTWLFSSMNVNENANRTTVWSDTLPGWETRNDRLGWRRLEQIERPAEIVSLTDNVNFYVPGHGHRDARESAGRSREVIEDQAVPGPDGDNRGSHRTLGRRPATMIDGHAEALPIRGAYWMDLAGEFRLAESSGGAISLYRSEVRHFLWFVRGDDAVADGGGD